MENKRNKELKNLWSHGKLSRKPEEQPKPPMDDSKMVELLNYLTTTIPEKGCDNTSNLTIKWLKEQKQPIEDVLNWMKENGGYCDCEIVDNALLPK